MEKKEYRGHVLAVPYPAQGHINPLLQFCKRLASKGFKATLAISTFIANSNSFADPTATVHLETISDGFDDGGFAQAESITAYHSAFEAAGSKSLAHLVRKHADSDHPINCIVYDSFMPWALDVAKQQGTLAATFFTQAVALGCIYYRVNRGLLRLPTSSPPVEIPGLPPLEIGDMPGYFSRPAEYPAYFEMVLEQYSNVDEADFILVNSFYELEAESRRLISAISREMEQRDRIIADREVEIAWLDAKLVASGGEFREQAAALEAVMTGMEAENACLKEEVDQLKASNKRLADRATASENELATRMSPHEVGGALHARLLEGLNIGRRIARLIDPDFSVDFINQRNRAAQRKEDLEGDPRDSQGGRRPCSLLYFFCAFGSSVNCNTLCEQ